VAFYTSHRRVWVVVKETNGTVSVRFFYNKDKGRVTARREAEKMFKNLSASIEERKGEK
jgi:hypothetical protein